MSRIVVFTDVHFNVEASNPDPDPVARLTSGLDHVVRHNGDAELVVITGDLTHKGDVVSYEQLAGCLARFDLPFHLMIGNHDNRENFLKVFPDVPADENGFVQHVKSCGERVLIFLDTLNAPPYDYPAYHVGHLCEQRLAWLDMVLTEAKGKRCVIFMHHPPHDTGFVAMDTLKLRNGPAFYDLVSRHGNVEHIVCGHVHRTISGSHRNIPFSIFKSTVGQMPMLFETMDFTMEALEPAAYGMVDLRAEGVVVHTEDFELTDLEAIRESLGPA